MEPEKYEHKKLSRKVISLEVKREIIKKSEQGTRNVILAQEYGLHKNTIQTILSQKDKIMTNSPFGNHVKITSPLQRQPLLDKVEKSLMEWTNEKRLKWNSSNRKVICEKARRIFEELKKDSPGNREEFKASKGWFLKFTKRAGIYDEESKNNVVDLLNTEDESLNSENDSSVFPVEYLSSEVKDVNRRKRHYSMISSLDGIIDKLTEISGKINYKEGEFELFGRSVVIQLNSMPLDRALLCQEKIQKILKEERVLQYRSKNRLRKDLKKNSMGAYIKKELVEDGQD